MQANSQTERVHSAAVVFGALPLVAGCWYAMFSVPCWLSGGSPSAGPTTPETHGTVRVKAIDARCHCAPGLPISESTRDGQNMFGELGAARATDDFCDLPFRLVGDFNDGVRIAYDGACLIYSVGEARWGLALAE